MKDKKYITREQFEELNCLPVTQMFLTGENDPIMEGYFYKDGKYKIGYFFHRCNLIIVNKVENTLTFSGHIRKVNILKKILETYCV